MRKATIRSNQKPNSLYMILPSCVFFLAANNSALSQDFTFAPSIAVAEIYDDNVFFNSDNPVDDLITRVSPAVLMEYNSARWDWNAEYVIDAENYRESTELNSLTSNQYGVLGTEYRFSPRQRIGITADYTDTQQAGVLNPTTSFESGRVEAQRITITPRYHYLFSSRTEGILEHMESSDSVSDGVDGDLSQSSATLLHVLDPMDTARFGVRFREFSFEDSTTERSLTPWVGWEHKFNDNATFRIEGGPQIYEDDTEAYISVGMDYIGDTNEFRFELNRDETLLAGQPGRVENESIQVDWIQQISNDFQLSIAPGYSSISGNNLSADVAIIRVDGYYTLDENFSIFAGYENLDQEQMLNTPSGVQIRRNVFTLGFRAQLRGESEGLGRTGVQSRTSARANQ